MTINLLKKISIATVSTAAIAFSLMGASSAEAATFSSDTKGNVYTGNTLEFTFENMAKTAGDVKLSVFAGADLDMYFETLGVLIGSGNNFTNIGNVFDGSRSSWGGVGNSLYSEGVDTLTISESLFNSLDETFTLKFTPSTQVNNFSYRGYKSYARVELDYTEKVPEPGTIAALSLLGVGGLLSKKKLSSVSGE